MKHQKKQRRKISYVLGAGFSYGTRHEVRWNKTSLEMPLQNNLFEKIFQYYSRSINQLDSTAKIIRKYFTPANYRSKRGKGASRHNDIKNLSVEEVLTFFEEMTREMKAIGEEKKAKEFIDAAKHLRQLTVKLIGFISNNGSPNKNRILKKFRDELKATDSIITFNWDVLLDKVLLKGDKKWHPSWGYGRNIKKIFSYPARKCPRLPKKHITLLKLHGSINWSAKDKKFTILKNPEAKLEDSDIENIVMIPPKMLKREIWGDDPNELKGNPPCGNWAVQKEKLYPKIWKEAEDCLSRSKRIVFIGYSFPAADTSVYGLLRRSFANAKEKYKKYPDVVIVDPNVAALAQKFYQSFQIEVPLENQFLSLSSYVLPRTR